MTDAIDHFLVSTPYYYRDRGIAEKVIRGKTLGSVGKEYGVTGIRAGQITCREVARSFGYTAKYREYNLTVTKIRDMFKRYPLNWTVFNAMSDSPGSTVVVMHNAREGYWYRVMGVDQKAFYDCKPTL